MEPMNEKRARETVKKYEGKVWHHLKDGEVPHELIRAEGFLSGLEQGRREKGELAELSKLKKELNSLKLQYSELEERTARTKNDNLNLRSALEKIADGIPLGCEESWSADVAKAALRGEK